MPAISIIIPTYERPRLACRMVDQIREQRFHDWELLVIDQSGPAIAKEIRDHIERVGDERVRFLHLAVKGHPNARDEGIARTTGPVVLFLDDDTILLWEDFLERHLRAYDDAAVGGVTGRIVERAIKPNTKRTMCRVARSGRVYSNLAGFEPTQLDTLKGANMSYRRDVFRQVGGFDRNFVGAFLEDAEFSTRVKAAGWVLLFEPLAEVFHYSSAKGGVRSNARTPQQTLYWRYRSTVYFLLKHRGFASLPFFAVTFGTLAIHRAIMWSEPGTLRMVSDAIREGVSAWRRGSDDAIPHGPP